MIKDYIVFDVDTTGLDKKHDYVNKIFAIKVIDNRIKDVFNVSFGYNSLEKKKKEFKEFIENLPLVTYNNEFNKAFFKIDINNEIIDIAKLSKNLYPSLKRHSLTHIANYLDIDIKNKIELSDYGFLAHEVFKKMLDDKLNLELKNYIQTNNNVTTSDIQRKFLIGINRAKKAKELYKK